jgi:anaerobic magnesium-protoporphyrin IX monomethyl ester cyclase
MADILLIQPPIRDFYLTAKRTIPYGLACVAGALIREGFDVALFDALATDKVRILDWPGEMDYLIPYYGKEDISPFGLFNRYAHYGYAFEHIGKIAKESGAFLIGISSLFTAYADEALETARVVKKFSPDARVVLGGHHPTALPEEVLSCRAVDYIIRGEGEVAMPLLAKAVQNHLPADSIPGVGFNTGINRFHIQEPAIMNRIDDFPMPADHLINRSYYRRKNKKSIVITASRGCLMKCSYCSLGGLSPVRYRRRSVDSIIGEIECAASVDDLGFIDFEDESLSLDRTWFMSLLREISIRFHQSRIELRAMNGLFPPSLDEEMVGAMKDAGFESLNLSLCSTVKRQLVRFLRPDATDAFEKALAWAEKHKLNAVGYIIAGAPGQFAEDTVLDLLFLARRRVLAGLSVFYPSPGSRDYETCRQAGLLPARQSLMRSSAIPISHTTRRVEAVTLLRLARILNFMKSLIDRGEAAVLPEPIREAFTASVLNRDAWGKRLLGGFLYDGKIRGLTKTGEIYEHHISEPLAQKFIHGLAFSGIRSCKY